MICAFNNTSESILLLLFEKRKISCMSFLKCVNTPKVWKLTPMKPVTRRVSLQRKLVSPSASLFICFGAFFLIGNFTGMEVLLLTVGISALIFFFSGEGEREKELRILNHSLSSTWTRKLTREELNLDSNFCHFLEAYVRLK